MRLKRVNLSLRLVDLALAFLNFCNGEVMIAVCKIVVVDGEAELLIERIELGTDALNFRLLFLRSHAKRGDGSECKCESSSQRGRGGRTGLIVELHMISFS